MDRQIDVALKRLKGDGEGTLNITNYFFLLNFSPSFSRLKEGIAQIDGLDATRSP